MSEIEKKDERNKRIGWIAAVAINLVLLIFFYFLIAWKAPNPPIPEYGIELGFATSAGATSSTPPPETEEETLIEDEVLEETEPLPTEEIVVPENAEQIENESETVTDIAEEAVVEDVESPVEVEETVSEPVEYEPTSLVEEKEKETDDSESMDQPLQETPSEEVVEKPVEEIVEEPETGDGQGEDEEEPAIDQRAIYGSQGKSEGTNEGASLSLAGWVWDFKPKPDDTSDQTGKIVYKIVVDSDGYLVKIDVATSTVSPTVERKYRQAVEKLTFSKTVDNNAAALSTGTITFIITSK
ncbi:MAG: hypothetical protein AB8B73_06925 [Ekhidna sp.]